MTDSEIDHLPARHALWDVCWWTLKLESNCFRKILYKARHIVTYVRCLVKRCLINEAPQSGVYEKFKNIF